MPDGTTTTDQTSTETQTTETTGQAGSRSIDGFSPEAQEYIQRLRTEAASRRNNEKDLTQRLKEFEDRDKTEQQKLTDRASTAEGRATSAETKLLRFEVAAEAGLPLKYANRLQGDTKEALAEDAKQLAQDLGLTEGGSGGAGRPGGFDGGVRRPVTRPTSMNDLIRQKAGF